MLLKSIKIENFKCIEDSTEFTLKPVTCLVGKNESGKTTIVQALYKLNPDIPEKGKFEALLEYPRRKWSEYKERHETSPDNVLTTKWELEENDIEALSKEFGKNILKNNAIIITKGYDNKRNWEIEIDEKQIIEHYLSSAGLEKEELAGLNGSETLADIINKLKTKDSPSDHKSKLLETLNKTFPKGDPVEAITNFLEKRLPIFLYFAEFYKMLGTVSINDLLTRKSQKNLEQGHRIFEALLSLVGTDAEDLNKIGRFEELIAELEAISNRLSQEIFEYWSQNRYLQVEFRFDAARVQDPPPYNSGFIFHTRIRNTRHGVTVSFDERSAGFVWFFSFLIWFSQLKRVYGEHLFILLDDPGLSLHARAQADLLRYINEKLKPNYQVIYTTHSPFMIDPDNLISVRTVEDVVVEEEILGTKIRDEVLGIDPDTIFPLQAALGYDMTQTLFVGKHTLLVEGPSDLLYLKLFSRELQEAKREYLDPRWVITPCGGIGKIGSFMALFGGRELHVAVLSDYHKSIKAKVRSIKESNLLKAGHVFSAEMYVDCDEADLEDIIGRKNYIALVNECYSLDETNKLSEEEKPSNAPTRVLEEVENHFSTTSTKEQFDHYTPALFLMEDRGKLSELPELDQALDRFERLFKDLNRLLPKD